MDTAKSMSTRTLRNIKPRSRRIVSPARSYSPLILYRETRGGQLESRTVAIAVLIAGALVSPAAAQRVIDGDTIDIDGIRYRLIPQLHCLPNLLRPILGH